jgi:hypothetical protein
MKKIIVIILRVLWPFICYIGLIVLDVYTHLKLALIIPIYIWVTALGAYIIDKLIKSKKDKYS